MATAQTSRAPPAAPWNPGVYDIGVEHAYCQVDETDVDVVDANEYATVRARANWGAWSGTIQTVATRGESHSDDQSIVPMYVNPVYGADQVGMHHQHIL